LEAEAESIGKEARGGRAPPPSGPVGPAELRILSFNTNSFNEHKRAQVLETMKTHKIDIFVGVDTRHRARDVYYMRRDVRNTLGPGYKVLTVDLEEESDNFADRVGGQVWILGPRVSKVTKGPHLRDGAMQEVQAQLGSRRISVIGNYWPCENKGPKSLWTRLGGRQSTAILHEELSERILHSRSEGRPLFVVGDFNCDLSKRDGDNHKLRQVLERLKIPIPTDQTPSYVSGGISSRIDHSLSVGWGVHTLHLLPHFLDLALESDHAPLHSYYELQGAEKGTEVSESLKLLPDLKRSDLRTRKRVQEILDREVSRVKLSRLSPEERLEEIGRMTVDAVQKATGRRRKRVRGWSPQVMALEYSRRALVRIKRALACAAKRPIWTERPEWRGDLFRELMKPILREWRRRTGSLGRANGITTASLLSLSCITKGGTIHPVSFEAWATKSLTEAQRDVSDHIRTVKTKMCGRFRTEYRKDISDGIRRLEEARMAGKIGRVIRSYMCSFRNPYTLEELKVDGETVVDQRRILRLVTSFFHTWFSGSTGALQRAFTRDMMSLTCEQFLDKHCASPIPRDLLAVLWKALQPRVNVEQRALFATELLQDPTLQDFVDAIDNSATDSAPGPSGLSYNMMKEWSPEIRMMVFEDLLDCWKRRAIPNYWKWRWLAPIPKKEEPDLEDLRPIVLIEPLRKVWATIFVRRIQSLWSAHGVLDSGQHAYLRGKGTDTALVEVLHALETTKEFKSSLYMSSWDMKRAFDSVPKELLMWAWIRLGVPEDLASYIVAMDIQGHTVIRSPLAYRTLRTGGYEALREHGMDFVAEKGTGQGDIPSPLNWDALFDILLTALKAVQGGEVHTQDARGVISAVCSTAYADDLISIQSDGAALQRMADVVSAFCAFSEVNFATSKFRAFRPNWGNASLVGDDEEHLVIHDSHWKPTRVLIRPDGTMKYLGVLIDMSLDGESCFNETVELIRTTCTRIRARAGSAENKWLAIRKSLYEKVAYRCRFMPWSLEKFQSLDKILAECIRAATKNMTSFPEALIFLPRRYAGLGFDSLADLCQLRKYSLMVRMLQMGGRSAHAMSGMLGRSLRDDGVPLVPGYASSEEFHPEDICKGHWATSLREWLSQLRVHIKAGGEANDGAFESIVSRVAREDKRPEPLLLDTLSANGILTTAEFLHSDEPPEWGVRLATGQEEATEEATMAVMRLASARRTVPLRTLQCWTTDALLESGVILEVIGFSGDGRRLNVMEWKSAGAEPLAAGSLLRAGPMVGSFCRGAGTYDWRDIDILTGNTAYLVVLSPDYHEIDGSNVAQVLYIRSRTPLPIRVARPAVLRDNLVGWCDDAVAIYTDGSWTERGSITERMSGLTQSRSYASVVKLATDGRWHGIRVRTDQPHYEAFTVELLAQAVAIELVTEAGVACPIYSDCQGAIALRAKATSGVMGFHYAGQLVPAASPVTIVKVEAHPERKRNRQTWDQNDWGIYLADRVAGPVDAVRELSSLCDIQEDDFLHLVRERSRFTVERMGSLLVHKLLRHCSWERHRGYLRRRDAYREARGVPPCWLGSGSLWAPLLHTKGSIADWAGKIRVIWDKLWIGRNRAKSRAGDPSCRLCGSTLEDQDHTLLRCPHPVMAECRRQCIETAVSRAKAARGEGKFRLAVQAYCRIASVGPDAYSLWTGVPTPLAMEAIRSAVGEDDFPHMTSLAKAVRGFAEGCMLLFRKRQELVDNLPDGTIVSALSSSTTRPLRSSSCASTHTGSSVNRELFPPLTPASDRPLPTPGAARHQPPRGTSGLKPPIPSTLLPPQERTYAEAVLSHPPHVEKKFARVSPRTFSGLLAPRAFRHGGSGAKEGTGAAGQLRSPRGIPARPSAAAADAATAATAAPPRRSSRVAARLAGASSSAAGAEESNCSMVREWSQLYSPSTMPPCDMVSQAFSGVRLSPIRGVTLFDSSRSVQEPVGGGDRASLLLARSALGGGHDAVPTISPPPTGSATLLIPTSSPFRPPTPPAASWVVPAPPQVQGGGTSLLGPFTPRGSPPGWPGPCDATDRQDNAVPTIASVRLTNDSFPLMPMSGPRPDADRPGPTTVTPRMVEPLDPFLRKPAVEGDERQVRKSCHNYFSPLETELEAELVVCSTLGGLSDGDTGPCAKGMVSNAEDGLEEVLPGTGLAPGYPSDPWKVLRGRGPLAATAGSSSGEVVCRPLREIGRNKTKIRKDMRRNQSKGVLRNTCEENSALSVRGGSGGLKKQQEITNFFTRTNSCENSQPQRMQLQVTCSSSIGMVQTTNVSAIPVSPVRIPGRNAAELCSNSVNLNSNGSSDGQSIEPRGSQDPRTPVLVPPLPNTASDSTSACCPSSGRGSRTGIG
jgi:exonuclease III